MDTDKKRIEERIEHYWDARSRDFGEKRRRELAGVNAQAWRSLFARYLPGNRQLHILDIGTGPGFFPFCSRLWGIGVWALICRRICCGKRQRTASG